MTDLKQRILDKAKTCMFLDFDVDNPKTWCEKIQWLQLNDDIELRARCADKIRVHDYCAEKIGKDICVPILYVYDSPNDVNFGKLPAQFVLKCNHGWNMNIIVDDKQKVSPAQCRKKLRDWIAEPFGKLSVEPHYLHIERKCFSEKYIDMPLDYKFWCFNGKPMMCTVNSNIGSNDISNYCINWYDMDWKFLPYSRLDHLNNPDQLDAKPNHFNLMKEYAEKLSADFRFVRVDFYEVDDIVYLGELTFTPNTGFIRWTDPNVDLMFGEMIKL